MSDETTEVRPWDLFKQRNYISAQSTKEVARKISHIRLRICKGCENFQSVMQTCKVCHCFMPAKTRLAAAQCPLDPPKWLRVEMKDEEIP